jgi:LysR family transcriptional regulator, glycine cleavage system transcriptional activator
MKRRNISLNALRSFEASARLGRQIAAAEELGVTHGAISRQVRQLEEHLGVPLFEGTRNHPQLTLAGQSLGPALTAAFDQIDDAIQAAIGAEVGNLDVACLSSFAMRWLIPRLHRFYVLHPKIDVRLSTNDHSRDLQQARVDLSIMVLDGSTKPNAQDLVLFPERLGVVLSPALAEAQNIKVIDDLDRVPHLTTKTRDNAWKIWREKVGMPQNVSSLKTSGEYEHYYFAIQATTSGLGACAVPYHLVSDDLAVGRLIAPFGFVETNYRYIARRRHSDNKLAIEFCAWLKSEVENQQ